tara:strand:- start:774 stop:1472 length:699 start_codon:yes stop_codon:yes gene_type:complete
MNPIRLGIKEGHLVMSGQTKYGKTTAALTLFRDETIFDNRKRPVSIFVDTKHDDSLLPHGFLAKSISDLQYHIDNKDKRIIYRPPGDASRKQHLTDIVQLLFRYRELASHKTTPFVVFVDEVQLYAAKMGYHEGLERLATTGAGKDIHGVFLAQRLQDIHQQTLSQCNTSMVFFMRDRPDYLKSQNMTELIEWMPWLKANRYYFAFQADGDWQLHSPVPLPNKRVDDSMYMP